MSDSNSMVLITKNVNPQAEALLKSARIPVQVLFKSFYSGSVNHPSAIDEQFEAFVTTSERLIILESKKYFRHHSNGWYWWIFLSYFVMPEEQEERDSSGV